jgi:hypothetical protein
MKMFVSKMKIKEISYSQYAGKAEKHDDEHDHDTIVNMLMIITMLKIVPDIGSVNYLDPGLCYSDAGICVCEGGGCPKPEPVPPKFPPGIGSRNSAAMGEACA